MSRPPSEARACSTRLSGSPGFETSAATQPVALIALPVLSIAAASRDEMKTFAPSISSASAHARPSPLLAAVTSARRSFSPRSTGEIYLPARRGGRAVGPGGDELLLSSYPEVLTYHWVTYWKRSAGSTTLLIRTP